MTDPLARAQAVFLPVADAAAQTEREGRLAALQHVQEAGLFRLLMPHSVGGAQAGPVEFLRVLEHLGQADASTAWCIAQTSVCSMSAALLDEAVARHMFSEPRAILAWGHGPAGDAVPCEGGWRIGGAWSFGSGSRHATWLGGSCTVGGITRMMLFPQSAASFSESWDVIGLRGTGSDTYAVTDLFVPAAHSFRFGDPLQPHADAPLYRMPPDSLWAAGFASVALGVARGMLTALVALAGTKAPRGQARPMAESAATQALVAESDAALRSAILFLHHAVTAAFQQAEDEAAVGLDRRMDIRLAASHAFREARAVTERCYHAAGATAAFRANPFERRLRDMHAISQHVHGRQQHFETVGQFMLGLAPDLAFL